VDERRDTEPGVLDEPALLRRERARSLHGVDRGGAERAGELAEAVGGEHGELAVLGLHRVLHRGDVTTLAGPAAPLPQPHQLGELLRQRHPGDELGDPGVLARCGAGGHVGAHVILPSTSKVSDTCAERR
jgi:hypothetical protein